MRKRIYFVRHGESVANATRVHASAETPLTDKGHEQAKFIAERASKLPVEIIIASTMTRAQQTAQYIAEEIGKPITNSDLFVEGKNPSEIIGRSVDEPEAARIQQLIDDKFVDPDFRHSDEENFTDVRGRAIQALEFLTACSEEHILVVSHGWFLSVVASVIILGKDLTPHECDRFLRTLRIENTGLSIVEHEAGNPRSEWSLVVWNDHAHLAD